MKPHTILLALAGLLAAAMVWVASSLVSMPDAHASHADTTVRVHASAGSHDGDGSWAWRNDDTVVVEQPSLAGTKLARLGFADHVTFTGRADRRWTVGAVIEDYTPSTSYELTVQIRLADGSTRYLLLVP